MAPNFIIPWPKTESFLWMTKTWPRLWIIYGLWMTNHGILMNFVFFWGFYCTKKDLLYCWGTDDIITACNCEHEFVSWDRTTETWDVKPTAHVVWSRRTRVEWLWRITILWPIYVTCDCFKKGPSFCSLDFLSQVQYGALAPTLLEMPSMWRMASSVRAKPMAWGRCGGPVGPWGNSCSMFGWKMWLEIWWDIGSPTRNWFLLFWRDGMNTQTSDFWDGPFPSQQFGISDFLQGTLAPWATKIA